MKSLYEQLKIEIARAEIANGLYPPIMKQVDEANKAKAWAELSIFLALLLMQHRDSKRGFQPLNPEKIKGTWPKGYVIKKRDL